jgi:2-polyprenyl-6-methoxyphenol hydroxylase-like FAD-dependent oxidoreductase
LVGPVRSQALGLMDEGAPCAAGRRSTCDAAHVGQGANQAIEDGVALAVFLEGRDTAEISDVLRRYETFRRERTDVVQAEAREQGLRLDSRSGSLQQRDQEIARSAEFRKWLYDYDVEKAAIAYLTKCGNSARV